MVAGMPGTGIGGIYYLLLAFLMPVQELHLLCRGRSSWLRWRRVAVQVCNASGVLVSLAATSWLVRVIAQAIARRRTQPVGEQEDLQQIQAVTSVNLAWLTLAILAVVVLGSLVVGEIYTRAGGTGSEPPVAPSIERDSELEEAPELAENAELETSPELV